MSIDYLDLILEKIKNKKRIKIGDYEVYIGTYSGRLMIAEQEKIVKIFNNKLDYKIQLKTAIKWIFTNLKTESFYYTIVDYNDYSIDIKIDTDIINLFQEFDDIKNEGKIKYLSDFTVFLDSKNIVYEIIKINTLHI